MMQTAADIIRYLDLKPHPTCGFVSETFRSNHKVPGTWLPGGYEKARALGSVLYFLVTPEAQIKLHRIRADQMYHYYLGDPLEVLLLYPDGKGEAKVVGPDLAKGMRPQLFIPGGTFHVSRLQRGSYSLLATSEWPAVEPADVEVAVPENLMIRYPAFADLIKDLCR